MSLQIRLTDFITAVGTDYKQLRTWISGSSTGTLTSLTTTDKTSLINAINEVKAGNTGAPPAATELLAGVAEIATTTETSTGTDDARFVTPLKLSQKLGTYVVPATELVPGIAEVATQAETTTGTDDARMVTPLKLAQKLAAYTVVAASETQAGIAEIATTAETTAGTDDLRMVTPLKLVQKLTAWAQPLNANLTTLAGVASGAFGRTLLGAADANAAKTSLGLAAVATSGSASDITTGTLPTSVFPPLAINDTFTVVSQAAMLALVAQRGDVAIRTDIGRSFILATDSPTTLADWKQLTAGGDVASVAGRTGAVVLTKTDVGLANVDNTSDATKPVSTAQAAADALNLKIASNLSDLNNVATARTNLSVYSQAEIGNPETDLVALYTAAKA